MPGTAAPTDEATRARTAWSIDIDAPRKRLLRWAGTPIPLEPQHAANAGFGGLPGRPTRTGWWIEDADPPTLAVVIEELDERIFAALLTERDWCITDASRRHQRFYLGEWQRYRGGQTMEGAYRPPDAPQTIAEARFVWTTPNRVEIVVPRGGRRAFKRLDFG